MSLNESSETMNRRSFFKTLAAIAAAVFAPRVAVQAKSDEQDERAKAEALGAELWASLSSKIRTVGGFYIGRAEDDFVRADGALGAQWLSPETFKIHSCRTLIGIYEFYPPVGGDAYYITSSNPTESIGPIRSKIWETFMGCDADAWPVRVPRDTTNQPDAT
jgi:hypothetical protein